MPSSRDLDEERVPSEEVDIVEEDESPAAQPINWARLAIYAGVSIGVGVLLGIAIKVVRNVLLESMEMKRLAEENPTEPEVWPSTDPAGSPSSSTECVSSVEEDAHPVEEETEMTEATVEPDPLDGYEGTPAANPARPLTTEELIARHAERVHIAPIAPVEEQPPGTTGSLPGYASTPAANPAKPLTTEELIARHEARQKGN